MGKKSNAVLIRMSDETYQKVQKAREIFSRSSDKPISTPEAIRRLMHEGAEPLIRNQGESSALALQQLWR